MMNNAVILAANEMPENAVGPLKLMIFMVVLMLVFWGINVFRHIKGGKWSKPQQTIDLAGIVMLVVLIILLVIPMI